MFSAPSQPSLLANSYSAFKYASAVTKPENVQANWLVPHAVLTTSNFFPSLSLTPPCNGLRGLLCHHLPLSSLLLSSLLCHPDGTFFSPLLFSPLLSSPFLSSSFSLLPLSPSLHCWKSNPGPSTCQESAHKATLPSYRPTEPSWQSYPRMLRRSLSPQPPCLLCYKRPTSHRTHFWFLHSPDFPLFFSCLLFSYWCLFSSLKPTLNCFSPICWSQEPL